MLMRLWFIQATGQDTTAEHFGGIHGLTTLVKAVEGSEGSTALALFGAAVQSREEIYTAIERHHVAVAQVGRQLAKRYAVDYPTSLEQMVTTQWREFRNQHAHA
jgi:hypothetical protein